MLALREILTLRLQHLEPGDQLDPSLGGIDHIVDVAPLGCDPRIGESLLVFLDQLLKAKKMHL